MTAINTIKLYFYSLVTGVLTEEWDYAKNGKFFFILSDHSYNRVIMTFNGSPSFHK